MAAKDESTIECYYEDFEPLCKWQRHDEFNILEVHLPEFEKDQIKIRMNSNNILIITGERSVKNNLRRRFQKEIKIYKNVKKDEIHANFVKGGVLHVKLPKNPRLESKILPSTYLGGTESSNFVAKISTKLAVQVGAILIAATFGALVYKYCFCVHIQR